MTISANQQRPDTAREPAARRVASGCVLLGLIGMLAGLPWILARAQGRSASVGREVEPYVLKGYFLMTLASAVKWPEQRSPGPFRIILVRCSRDQERAITDAISNFPSPVGGELKIESERRMGTDALTNLAGAHVLFFGRQVQEQHVLLISRSVASSPILTVTDDKTNLVRQGNIGAVRQQGEKVIVSVSLTNLGKAGLSLNSAIVDPLVKANLLEMNQ